MYLKVLLNTLVPLFLEVALSDNDWQWIYDMIMALVYSLRVWLTGAALGSILFNLKYLIDISEVNNVFDLVLITVIQAIFAAVFSLPSWLLLFLFTYLFTKQEFNVVKTKIWISMIGFVLAVLPLLWFTHGVFDDFTLILLTYPAVIVTAIWHYPLANRMDIDDIRAIHSLPE